MKNKTMRKTNAILNLKIKMLSKNTSALLGPIMAIGMTVLMRFLYSSTVIEDPKEMDMLLGMALSMGVSFSIGAGAVMMSALPLAEDKEKHTLRSLMTSSVNGKQFFIGSLLPPLVITILVNYIIIFVSGANLANFDFIIFSFVTILSSIASCMLGLLIGVLSKSQVHANNIMTVFILVLSILPTFASLNEAMATVSGFVYTGICAEMIDSFVAGKQFTLEIQQLLILVISVVIFTAAFLYFYKKNALESE